MCAALSIWANAYFTWSNGKVLWTTGFIREPDGARSITRFLQEA
jgi:hypothetical protein